MLTSKQRTYLKAAAHHLRPVIQIGKGGVTPALIAELSAALENLELIKIKVNRNAGEADDKDAVAALLSEKLPGLFPVFSIGHMLVVFRQSKERPTKYTLPE